MVIGFTLNIDDVHSLSIGKRRSGQSDNGTDTTLYRQAREAMEKHGALIDAMASARGSRST